MKFIILKFTVVNKIICHYHLSLISLIIFPYTIENTSILPYHLTLPISASLGKIPCICSHFIFYLWIHRLYRIFIVHCTLSIRTSIFKHANKFVVIWKVYLTSILKSTIVKAPILFIIIFYSFNRNVKISYSIFDYTSSICFIFNKLTLILKSIQKF